VSDEHPAEGAGWRFVGDPDVLGDLGGIETRLVQPYQALKRYRCPGCDQDILPRTLHLVAWPGGRPEERRHWHRPCFERWGGAPRPS
jgi:hypothetical protein